jgi:hypothetical protein
MDGGSLLNGRIAIPESLATTFVKQFHRGTHSGKTALEATLAQHFYGPKFSSINKAICENVAYVPKTTPARAKGTTPGAEHWQNPS